jgi:hypothetical protein
VAVPPETEEVTEGVPTVPMSELEPIVIVEILLLRAVAIPPEEE